MSVICQNCQAVNRDKAMFCRGCAGKLPAFVATAPASRAGSAGAAGSSSAGARSASAGAPDRTSSVGMRPTPHDRSVRRGWFAAILLLGVVAAALVGWIALSPGRTVAAVTAPAPAPAPAASAASAAVTATVSNAVAFESALAPGESAVAADPAPTSRVDAAVDTAPPPGAVPAPTARPATPARAQTPPRNAGNGRADPRIGCEHLFFAFAARCEANHCAEAAYARHPRCDVVRAERQRDDARRNMTSGY